MLNAIDGLGTELHSSVSSLPLLAQALDKLQ